MDIQYIYPSPDQKYLERLAPTAASDNPLIGANISFGDLIDVVNPLQQLPVIGDIYRSLSGDTISAGARMAGGFLMGGPMGFMVAAATSAFEAATGGGLGATMLAAITGSPAENQYAAAAYRKTSELG